MGETIGRPAHTRIYRHLTTTIPNEDYVYVKQKGLKFQALMMAAIRDHRVHSGEPHAEISMREMQQKINRIMETLKSYAKFIEEKGLFEEFVKEKGFCGKD